MGRVLIGQRVTVLQGKFHEGVASMNIEFLADIGAVILNRTTTDEKVISDLFAGLVVSKQLQHTPFHRRERVESAVGLLRMAALDKVTRKVGADVVLACNYCIE